MFAASDKLSPRPHDRAMPLSPTLAWLVDEAAASPGADRFLADLGTRLIADGLPLAGGALTLAILFARRLPLPPLLSSQAWIARLHNAKTGIPYGIALALGGLAVYPQTQFWGLINGV